MTIRVWKISSAALGLTERTDAVVVVVSEERAEISLASNGRMLPDLDEVRLGRQLHRLFDVDGVSPEAVRPTLDQSGGTERRAS